MNTGGITLFIVETSSLILNRFQLKLGELECVKEIFAADNTASALDLFKHNSPDLVLLDFHVDYGRGIELLKQIKKRHPSVIIVMLCNEDSHAYRDFCHINGADGFFDKSIEVKQILTFVRAICEFNR